MSVKETAYKEVMSCLRFFLDYRTKIFGFCIAINGAIITIVASKYEYETLHLVLPTFAAIVTLLCLLADIRASSLANRYRESAIDLEYVLKICEVTEVHEYAKGTKLTFRKLFRAMYLLMIIGWLITLVIIVPYPT